MQQHSNDGDYGQSGDLMRVANVRYLLLVLAVLAFLGYPSTVTALDIAQTTWEVDAEVVTSVLRGASTPSSWNPNLPKLVGDSAFLYAVHTYYPDAIAQRYAYILKRPRAGSGNWTVVATFRYVHQPPGLVMDAQSRLHVVFECLRPSPNVAVECFRGGAGTGGLMNRFYHLIFKARNPDGSLRFDTYANYNETLLVKSQTCRKAV